MVGRSLAPSALPDPIPFQDNEGMHRPREQEERLVELHSLHCPPGHRLWLQRWEEVGEPEGRRRICGFPWETKVLLPKAPWLTGLGRPLGVSLRLGDLSPAWNLRPLPPSAHRRVRISSLPRSAH